jgi:pimeloyl-ACP methyl ester carboxylesterase
MTTLPPPVASPLPGPSPHAPADLVVLTHGIASSRYFMWPMARHLRRCGYDTRLYGYPSLRGSNRVLGENFAQMLHRLAEQNPGRKLHVVAHSMGSIMTRCALLAGVPQSVSRVVMIGPPNRGSHVATRLSPALGWIAPTLRELCDHQESFVNCLPRRCDVEVGIITAEYDRMVKPESTLLDENFAHLVLPNHHTPILWYRRTAEHVDRFLRNGQFG